MLNKPFNNYLVEITEVRTIVVEVSGVDEDMAREQAEEIYNDKDREWLLDVVEVEHEISEVERE